MKKKFLIVMFLFVCVIVGCELNNTPTSKVEEYLTKYQMLDQDVSISYTDLAEETELDNDIKDRYVELIKKQYRNLSYEIKDETIDGETATVTVQIKVVDYQKVMDSFEKIDDQEYHNQLLSALEKANEKVSYTIYFVVNKDSDGNWGVEPLSALEKQKLLGVNKQNPNAYT